MGLIAALRQKQGCRTQMEFAAELGISQSYLSLLYSGGRQNLSPELARRIVQLYPDLTDEIIRHLLAKPDPWQEAAG